MSLPRSQCRRVILTANWPSSSFRPPDLAAYPDFDLSDLAAQGQHLFLQQLGGHGSRRQRNANHQRQL